MRWIVTDEITLLGTRLSSPRALPWKLGTQSPKRAVRASVRDQWVLSLTIVDYTSARSNRIQLSFHRLWRSPDAGTDSISHVRGHNMNKEKLAVLTISMLLGTSQIANAFFAQDQLDDIRASSDARDAGGLTNNIEKNRISPVGSAPLAMESTALPEARNTLFGQVFDPRAPSVAGVPRFLEIFASEQVDFGSPSEAVPRMLAYGLGSMDCHLAPSLSHRNHRFRIETCGARR